MGAVGISINESSSYRERRRYDFSSRRCVGEKVLTLILVGFTASSTSPDSLF